MSEPSSSKQAQQNGSTSDEPVNPGLPPAPAVQSDDDDDDKPVRKMTPTEKFKIIEGILEAPDDAKQIQEAVEKALPSDVILNFRQIQAAIHSDRFPDPVNKDKATRAFQS
ncbi:hypothetical protein N7510_011602 [Penicillium lagena]|uniref:uncharacterized protein n=1 Tax=Penicillium lagena TaxID=94218 RepID=UPI0025418834|nr:uncharacterized protein N7510_011602 [Penicillium lagena]KAJ5602068.1 hypothetical protein N7510_011602 [Penicillium lagena]